MRKTNENKGITLIALVITIIILLILAGISVAMLTGNVYPCDYSDNNNDDNDDTDD